tara:strand:- start:219 stop:455 length:237 start_codon:yes stop_codon:yes gene_type:complete
MNNKRRKKNIEHQHLATLVYEEGMRKKIEEEMRSKYEKRIDYLIGANNELFHKLEQCEKEKERFASIADNILLNEELT